MNDEIRHLITGFGEVTNENLIQAARRYLGRSQGTGIETKTTEFIPKKEEAIQLIVYISDELGLILEDLHEENVLSNNGLLFFIDTVIYYKKS